MSPMSCAPIYYLTVSMLPGMVWLSQLTSSPYLCVAILSLAYTTNGAHYSGDTVNMLQIAPNRYLGPSNKELCLGALFSILFWTQKRR